MMEVYSSNQYLWGLIYISIGEIYLLVDQNDSSKFINNIDRFSTI
jgi:hypothetical protein